MVFGFVGLRLFDVVVVCCCFPGVSFPVFIVGAGWRVFSLVRLCLWFFFFSPFVGFLPTFFFGS